ncbi:MAG TPA: ester cyclase [bacterium]|nr:ester cyclase [bacterium]
MLRKLTLALALFALPALAVAGPAEDNEATMLRFYEEAVNQGDLEAFDEFMAESFVEHEELPGIPPTRDGVKQWFGLMRTAFPDLKFDVEFTMADGDRVAAYLTISGTQAAEFLGVPSQGRAFSVKTIDIVRFQDGKAVEHWGVTDTGVMMQQLTGE